MNDRITVAICTLNRSIELCVMLSSLSQQTFKDWDLVIVDESPEYVLSYMNAHIENIALSDEPLPNTFAASDMDMKVEVT